MLRVRMCLVVFQEGCRAPETARVSGSAQIVWEICRREGATRSGCAGQTSRVASPRCCPNRHTEGDRPGQPELHKFPCQTYTRRTRPQQATGIRSESESPNHLFCQRRQSRSSSPTVTATIPSHSISPRCSPRTGAATMAATAGTDAAKPALTVGPSF